MVRIAPALAALLLPLGAEAACPADDLGCAVEELREDMASIRSQLAGVQSLTLKLEERLARLERGYGELREEVRARPPSGAAEPSPPPAGRTVSIRKSRRAAVPPVAPRGRADVPAGGGSPARPSGPATSTNGLY